MSSRGVASSRRVQAAERREQAWLLRKRGYSFRQIAKALEPELGSYSKSQAERDIKQVLEELNARTLETAASARALDLARLDELLVAWFDTALREHERPAARSKQAEYCNGVAAAEAVVAATGLDSVAWAGKSELNDIDWSTLTPMELLEAVFKQAMLSKHAVDIVLRVLEQRAKLLGLHRHEVALTTPAPLQVAADLSGLDEESLDAIIRNLTAAIGAGGS